MKALTPDQAERQQFYDLLWGDTPGYIEAMAGASGTELDSLGWLRPDETPDPDKIYMLRYTGESYETDKANGRPSTRRVFEWPKERAALDRHIAKLINEWGNAFICQTLYGTRNGNSLSDFLPSKVFVLDDGPETPELAYSFCVETSPYSRQGFYQIDRAQPPKDLEILARGAVDRIGADTSTTPRGKLCRVPTGRNTKAKADHHRVTFHAGAGSYPVETVARTFLPGGYAEMRQAATTHTSGAEPTDPAVWNDLPDGAVLMNTPRYKRMFQRRPQLAKLAAGERITLPTKHGMLDTGSEQVAILVSNLLTDGRPAANGGPVVPGLGAPPMNEIRALALHWQTTLRPGYPTNAYKADIDRIARDYTPATYAPEPTRIQSEKRAAEPCPLAPSRGRPVGQRAAHMELLAEFLAARIGKCVARKEMAAAIGVHIRMISEYLADLRQAGRLESVPAGRGIRVARCAIKSRGEVCNRSEAETPVHAIPAQQTANAEHQKEHSRQIQGQEIGAPSAPEPPNLDGLPLVELVTRAIDYLQGTEVLNRRHGHFHTQRGTLKQVRAWIAKHAPSVDLDQLASIHQAEAERRRKAKKNAPFIELRQKARDFTPDQLRAARDGTLSRWLKLEQKHAGKPYTNRALREFEILEETRRRRGIPMGCEPAPRRGFAESKADTAQLVASLRRLLVYRDAEDTRPDRGSDVALESISPELLAFIAPKPDSTSYAELGKETRQFNLLDVVPTVVKKTPAKAKRQAKRITPAAAEVATPRQFGGSVLSPGEARVVPSALEYDAGGLIARLRARQTTPAAAPA